MMDRDDIKEEIKRRTDIVELVSQYVTLQRAGRRMKARCPFHEEKTPSFFVDPATGLWKCFGCGEGGDVFSFLMKIEGLSFPEAAERLAERVGLVWRASPVSDQRARLRKQVQKATDIAARHFQANLRGPQGAAARRYLQRRGFTAETIERFRLGFALNSWDDLLRALARNGIDGKTAVQAGLARTRDSGGQYDWFRNRIIFPILDAGGRVIAFGGRTLDPDEAAKYINSPDTPIFQKGRTVYGLHAAWRGMADSKQAVVVEGYTDVISLHQAGFNNVVACMGTALSREHLRVLGRYVEQVVLCYDADAAGIQAALRNAALFEASNVDVRIAVLPAGQDPDEVVRQQGAEAFRRIIQQATSVVEYRLQIIFERHKSQGAEGLSRAAREAAAVLVEVPDHIRRDMFVVRAADRWAAGDTARHEAMQGALRAEILRRQQQQRRGWGRGRTGRGGAPSSLITETLAKSAAGLPRWRRRLEEELLAIALQDEAQARRIVQKLAPEDFADPRHRRIMAAVQQHLQEAKTFEPSRVIDGLQENEGTKAKGVELLLSDIQSNDIQEVVTAAIAKLRKYRLSGGLREKYEIAGEELVEAEGMADEDFELLQRRIVERANRGELSHDDPDYQRYLRLVALFHGKGRGEFVEYNGRIGAGNGDHAAADNSDQQADEQADKLNDEGS